MRDDRAGKSFRCNGDGRKVGLKVDFKIANSSEGKINLRCAGLMTNPKFNLGEHIFKPELIP